MSKLAIGPNNQIAIEHFRTAIDCFDAGRFRSATLLAASAQEVLDRTKQAMGGPSSRETLKAQAIELSDNELTEKAAGDAFNRAKNILKHGYNKGDESIPDADWEEVAIVHIGMAVSELLKTRLFTRAGAVDWAIRTHSDLITQEILDDVKKYEDAFWLSLIEKIGHGQK